MNTLHRQRYVNDSIATASPARLLCMLYDRLLRDLQLAESAVVAGDRVEAGAQLVHAQEIVLELQASLDISKWQGGPGLAAVYSFLHRQLIQANLKQDVAIVRSCRNLLEPLADAWHQAANQLLAVSPRSA